MLSSVAAVRARQTNFLYGSAKAGLDRFARGLGESLSGSGAMVQIVRPGFVHTKMTRGRRPAPFAVGTEAVAAAVVRGLQTKESVIWVPGTLRWVFPILQLLPRWIWRRLPD